MDARNSTTKSSGFYRARSLVASFKNMAHTILSLAVSGGFDEADELILS